MLDSDALYRDMTTLEVKAALERDEPLRLIDIREPQEHALAAIEGAELLPLSRAREWIRTLPQDENVVLFCHHGVRSQSLAHYLSAQLGFRNIANMIGGIDDWSLRIDPDVPRY